MEKRPKEAVCWPVFLPGAVLGLATASFYFLRGRISEEWFGGLCVLMVIAILVYYCIAICIQARLREKTGKWKRYGVGAALAIGFMLDLAIESLRVSLFFHFLGDILDRSGWIWIVLGIAFIVLSWFCALHPVVEDPPAAPSKDTPPPWEG